ncbi:MAG: hypothetical protein M3548_10935 [Actinomycetota bacterium]|nr:hypothetical protein [Actinomycetota bacterium]
MIIVDAYGEEEQGTAFLTVIEDETPLPARASLMGSPVTVVEFDYHDGPRGLTVRCEGEHGAGEVALADVVFPPDTVTAWIHAAYRRWLGVPPFAATPRPDWTWPSA